MEFHFLHPSILNKEHLFSPVMPTLCYRSPRVVNCGFVKNLQGFFFKHWKKAIFWFRIYTSSDGPLDSRALALWVCLVFSVSCHVFLLSEESQPSPGIREAVAAACVHHLKVEWDRDVWLLCCLLLQLCVFQCHSSPGVSPGSSDTAWLQGLGAVFSKFLFDCVFWKLLGHHLAFSNL